MAEGGQSQTEVTPEIVSLGRLLERVVKGKIRVPCFQRAYVWNHSRMLSLLDSVRRGFPIGSILIWDTDEEVTTVEYMGPVPIGSRPDGLFALLLDGQQRLSTLVGTLHLPEGRRHAHGVDWRVYYDLEQREFLHTPAGGLGAQHFPVRSLLNTTEFLAGCRRIETGIADSERAERLLAEADRLASAFRDYQLPLIRIREADVDAAVTAFARLNMQGRKMAADEMVSALTYREGGFNLAESLDELLTELGRRGFGDLERVFVLRAVLAAMDLDIYAKEWADLVVKEEVRSKLPEAFEAASGGIRLALDFLAELGVTSVRLLPYGLQLVLLAELFRICPAPSASVRELLKRWFWVTSFTGWFAGVNATQARRALEEVQAVARGEHDGFDVVDLDAPAQPFPDRFDGRSARVRAFLLYLVSLEPRSLLGAGRLDPGMLLSEMGPRALAYVSSNRPLLGELHRSPANRMFVDRDHVGQTYDALKAIDDAVLDELLPTHGFGPLATAWFYKDDRRTFVRDRKDALIEGEREFMQARGVALPVERTGPAVADSDADDEDDAAPDEL